MNNSSDNKTNELVKSNFASEVASDLRKHIDANYDTNDLVMSDFGSEVALDSSKEIDAKSEVAHDSSNYGLENAVTMAINAGADMLIFGNQLSDRDQDPKEIIQLIAKKVADGDISEDRINEAYERIRTFKKNLR